MTQKKSPLRCDGDEAGNEAAVVTTSPKMVPRTNIRLSDLDHHNHDVRHEAARRAWSLIKRLDRDRAWKLYDRYASEPPKSPGWKLAELARLRIWLIDQEKRGGDLCPHMRCQRHGLWTIDPTGEVHCRCLAGGAA